MTVDPSLPGAGHAELVLKIGPDAKVFAEVDPDSSPVVCIQAGDWQVLFYPHAWVEGMSTNQAEADRASDIVIAFSQWRNAIMERAVAERNQSSDDDLSEPI